MITGIAQTEHRFHAYRAGSRDMSRESVTATDPTDSFLHQTTSQNDFDSADSTDIQDTVSISEEATNLRGEPLSDDEQKELEQLQHRDVEVRLHEQAHKAAAGRYARGGASFEFEVGPDGARYAVGGEVQIDSGQESSPEATVQKARAVRQAALAPSNPSAQDRRVAANASSMEQSARKEIAEEKTEDQENETETADIEAASSTPSEKIERSNPASAPHIPGISSNFQDSQKFKDAPTQDQTRSVMNHHQDTGQHGYPYVNLSHRIRPSMKAVKNSYGDNLSKSNHNVSPGQNSIEALSIAI
jgi:hypothetical protein